MTSDRNRGHAADRGGTPLRSSLPIAGEKTAGLIAKESKDACT